MGYKVLLIAHEFSPDIGSECEQGWNLCLNICRSRPDDEFYILAASKNQFGDNNYELNVKKYYGKGIIPENTQVLFINYNLALSLLGAVNAMLRKYFGVIGFPPLFFFIYTQWQKTAFNFISFSYGRSFFDVVHVVNKINAAHPGPWWKLDARLFWGPTGGREIISGSLVSSLKEKLRNLYISSIKKSKNVKMTIQKASQIFVFDNSKFDSKNISYFPESGVELLDERIAINKKDIKDKKDSLKVIFSGQYIYRKGFDIFLDIATHFSDNNRYSFISSGKGEIASEHMGKNYTDLGFLPRESFLNQLETVDILILPSYREGTPQAIMEAISRNVLVISTDVGGISHFISSKALISYISKDQVKSDIVELLENIGDRQNTFFNMLLREQKNKAKELSWMKLSRSISSYY